MVPLVVHVVDQIWSTSTLLLVKTVVFGAINAVRTPPRPPSPCHAASTYPPYTKLGLPGSTVPLVVHVVDQIWSTSTLLLVITAYYLRSHPAATPVTPRHAPRHPVTDPLRRPVPYAYPHCAFRPPLIPVRTSVSQMLTLFPYFRTLCYPLRTPFVPPFPARTSVPAPCPM